MILVTSGSTSFDDLIRRVDEMEWDEEVVLQIGRGLYAPKRHSYFTFKPSLEDELRRARLVVTHSGAATLLESCRFAKKVIVIDNPETIRLPEVADRLESDGLVLRCRELAELPAVLSRARHWQPARYEPPPCKIPDEILGFLEGPSAARGTDGLAETAARNTGWLMAGTLFKKASSLVVLLLLTRRLGLRDFGRYQFALDFSGIFLFLLDLGVAAPFVREAARDRTGLPHRLAAWLGLKLALTPAFALAVAASVLILRLPAADRPWIALGALGATSLTFVSALEDSFQSISEMKWIAVLQVFDGLARLGLVAALVAWGAGLPGLLGAAVATAFLDLVAAACLARRRHIVAAPSFDLAAWRKLLWLGAPFALKNGIDAIFFRLNSTILMLFKGPAAVGAFTAAQKIVSALNLPLGWILTSVFPALCTMHRSSRERAGVWTRTLLTWQTGLLLAASGALCVLARPLTRALFGPGFEQSAEVLRVLAWVLPLSAASRLLNVSLAAADMERKLPIVTTVSGVTYLSLSLPFIARFGSLGAAFAAIAAQGVAALFALYFLSAQTPGTASASSLQAPGDQGE